MQTWLSYFINRISPYNEVKEKANYYSNEIIEFLNNKNLEVDDLRIAGAFAAGSNAMDTLVRNIHSKEFDVDISVYFEGKNALNTNLSSLLHKMLFEAYPNKSKKDFKITEKAVTIQFENGTKINVCVIPLILDENRPRNEWWGHLLLSTGAKILTCIPRHIQYVKSRTNQTVYPVRFNTVVQIMKWWSKYHKLNLQGRDISIFTGYSFDKHPFPADWFHTLDQVFSYYKKLYPVLINAKDGSSQFIDPIVNTNYIKNLSSYDLEKFKLKTEETYNTLYDAKVAFDYGNYKQSISHLQDIFGLEFQINTSKMKIINQLAI